MSHKGASEGYGQTIIDPATGQQTPQYIQFAKKAVQWNSDGVVVGATYPEKIAEIKKILADKVAIYSPGVGTQGGAAQLAVKSGADYLIVGREITLADDPTAAAKRLIMAIREN